MLTVPTVPTYLRYRGTVFINDSESQFGTVDRVPPHSFVLEVAASDPVIRGHPSPRPRPNGPGPRDDGHGAVVAIGPSLSQITK